MNDHHFNVQVAIDFDPETAIFLNNMAYWLNITVAKREHYYEDRYWLFNSYTQWAEIFPYFTAKQMRRIIDNSVDKGLLMKGCFNQKRYDNTNWYTLTDKALEYYPRLKEQILNTPAQTGKGLAQTGKGLAQTGRPIPDTKPDTNPEEKLTNCKDSSSSSFFFSQTLDKSLLLQRLSRDTRTDEEFLSQVKEHVDHHSDKNFARMQRAQGALRLLKKLKDQNVIFCVPGSETKDEDKNKPQKLEETDAQRNERQYFTYELIKESEGKGYVSKDLQKYPEMREKYAKYAR